jgi:hypothetical protein
MLNSVHADHSGRVVKGMKCLRPLVGSNLTQGMDVCFRLFCVYVVLCKAAALQRAHSPSKESYRLF